jgi:two-component system, OmpR family, alkaline phosphatase synthesis response regulator PhoP
MSIGCQKTQVADRNECGIMKQENMTISSRPPRILVVDDERHIARLLVHILTQEGYEARAVYDGEQALAAVESFSPDGVLLDLLLPKLSGQEVLSRLRSDPRFSGLKILMLTGCPVQEGDVADPLNSGADAYCLKPIGPSVLISLLRQHGLTAQAENETVL